MSRFDSIDEQAEDAMRPGSKTQTRSIRLETANGADEENESLRVDAQVPGAGTLLNN